MVRSFLPVGQGAFYCECFEGDDRNIHIVYDCGSLTDVKIVEREIRHYFQKNEVIDALFISHLDEDHINGVPFLLKYCKVRKIYFPLITSANKKILSIYFHVNNNDRFVVDFLDNPIQAIDSLNLDYRPDLIQIDEAPSEGMERGNNNLDIPRSESGTSLPIDMNFSDVYGRTLYSEWLYIPFNFRQEDRIVDLMNKLQDIYGRRITEDEVEYLWRNGTLADQDKIKEAYRKVPGGMNTNSMTLFSGEIEEQFRQFANRCCKNHCYRFCYHRDFTPSGCLYTGDYYASGKIKWRQLVDAYQKYWDHIGCVQIPHHGSRHGFNPDFLDMDAHFVISCGCNNKYRHPHTSVIRSFLLRSICPHIVTEHYGSVAYYVIK